MASPNDTSCSCWRCWTQSNFTALALLWIVLLSFLATVILMHEDRIEDKYVTWLEGFCGGAMTSLAVALKTSSSSVAPHLPQQAPSAAPPDPPNPPGSVVS